MPVPRLLSWRCGAAPGRARFSSARLEQGRERRPRKPAKSCASTRTGVWQITPGYFDHTPYRNLKSENTASNRLRKEAARGSAISSSNQAVKWGARPERSCPAKDGADCCVITAGRQPELVQHSIADRIERHHSRSQAMTTPVPGPNRLNRPQLRSSEFLDPTGQSGADSTA